jgi:hypothetical protein
VLDHPQAEHTRQLLADLPGLSAASSEQPSTGAPGFGRGPQALGSTSLSRTEGTSSIPS